MKLLHQNSKNSFYLFILLIFLSGTSNKAFTQESTENSIRSESTQITEYAESDSIVLDSVKSDSTWKIGWFPVIFYSNETKWAGGSGIQLVKKGYTQRHSSSIGVLGFYTQNNQYTIIVNTGMFLKKGTYKLGGEIAYIYFPDKFYGIGNNTAKEDEEKYTTRLFRFKPLFQRRLFSPNFYIGFHYDYAYTDVVETEAGKILNSGIITGSNGGAASGIGLDLTWDTRNDNLCPMSGSYYQFMTGFYSPTLGSDFTFNSYLIDMRQYMSIFNKHVIAFRGVVGINTGEPPFQMLYFTGSLGVFLRGYTNSRFMDKNVLTFQAEYRLPLIWRFGLVGFAGFGQVAPEFDQVSLNNLKPSAGFGIRFALIPEQKVNLRLDIGIGKDDGSFNINIMEAF